MKEQLSTDVVEKDSLQTDRRAEPAHVDALKTQKAVAEQSGFANNIDIHAEVGEGKDPKNSSLGSDRAALVRNELRKKVSWWDWYDQSVPGDDLKIYIKIR